MKDTVGLLLRERWKEKGTPYCPHPEFSQERSFSGTLTGAPGIFRRECAGPSAVRRYFGRSFRRFKWALQQLRS